MKAEDGSLKVHAGVCDYGQIMINAMTDHSATWIDKALKMCRESIGCQGKVSPGAFHSEFKGHQQAEWSTASRKVKEADIKELVQTLQRTGLQRTMQRLLELKDYVHCQKYHKTRSVQMATIGATAHLTNCIGKQ